MYDGYFKIFIGISSVILSFFMKNNKDEYASFIRKYNKHVLIIGGLLLILFGTIDLVKSLSASWGANAVEKTSVVLTHINKPNGLVELPGFPDFFIFLNFYQLA